MVKEGVCLGNGYVQDMEGTRSGKRHSKGSDEVGKLPTVKEWKGLQKGHDYRRDRITEGTGLQ